MKFEELRKDNIIFRIRQDQRMAQRVQTGDSP